MEIRVLGCYGGELPGFRLCSLLIDGKLLLDAGAVTSVLDLQEQRRISDILVTHAHLDHIKDIPFLAANLVGEGFHRPVNIIASRPVIETIKYHLFNDALWPDFTMLPTMDAPILKFFSLEPGVDFRVGCFTVRAIPVNHSVQATAFLVRKGKAAVLYTGDTGATDRIWEEADSLAELKAIFVELSFPNRLGELAASSGHLFPRLLERELKKLRRKDIPIYLVHMKPLYLKIIGQEVGRMMHRRVSLAKQGRKYRF